MSFALGRRVLDKNNCKELSVVIDAFNDLHDALGNPVNNPGPGVDGAVPDLYTPVYADGDGNLTTGTVLTTVKIIAGLTTGVVTGPADFTIDNLVTLTEGFTVPAEPLSVVNTIGLSCGDNTAVYAIYRPDNATWHTWTDTTAASASFTAGLGLTVTTGEFALDDTGFNGSDALLYGSVAAAFQFDTVGGWLERLGNYESVTGAIQLIGHREGDDPEWDGVGNWLAELDNYGDEDSQMIGAESTTPRWYPMATLATGLTTLATASTTPFVEGDNFETSGGATPPVAAESIQNTFGYGLDDNTPIVVMRAATGSIDAAFALTDDPPDSSLWHIVQAMPVQQILAEANGAATDPLAEIAVDTLEYLWGRTAGSDPTTFSNPFKLTPENNGAVWGIRFPGTSDWYALQAAPVALNVITDITSLAISGGNLVLTYRQQSINVASINSASTEETITIPVTTC